VRMSDISDSDNGRRFQGMDAGAPMPDLSTKGIQLSCFHHLF
jgi:hypothetical protein